MNIYIISQYFNAGYDTYDSAVVIAKDENDARTIHPNGYALDDSKEPPAYRYGRWCQTADVKVELIGKALKGAKRGVVCASFNAG